VDDGGLIHGLTVLRGRLKLDLTSSRFGLFIQAISETLNYTQHFNFTICAEQNLKAHIAFDLLRSSLIGIDRLRIE
jgi:hypothetical protein